MAKCLAIVTAAVAAVSATTLDLSLLPSSYREALCNDGTMSGYWFRASPTNSSVWIVHQQGGGWCYDSASCKGRSSTQRSSKDWPATMSVEGLFDSTDARLKTANLAYVGYCSSDGYAGNADASVSSFGFAFRGRAIVAAVFDDLRVRHGLGTAPGTQVLYGGCSAGARGALWNAGSVHAGLLATVGANLSRFGVLLDSAFWVDIAPLVSTVSFGDEVKVRSRIRLVLDHVTAMDYTERCLLECALRST